MARILGSISTGTTETVYGASSLNNWKTVLQLVVSANHVAAVKGFSISFDGVSVTAQPVMLKLVRQSNAGTGGTAVTAYEESLYGVTLQTTGQKGSTSGIWTTTEPSDVATGLLRVYNVHPQTGIEVRFNADDEILVGGASGGRLGLCMNADAAVNCFAHISFEE